MDKTFEITRSFSKKVQIKQYEPEDYFCSVTQTFYSQPTPEVIESISETLFKFCEQEVLKSMKERVQSVKKEISDEESPY